MVKKLFNHKYIAGVLVFVLLFSMNVAYGAGSTITSWAVTDVNAAIDNQLVPEVLQTNYTSSIKRYEYVLLALKVLEKSGTKVDIIKEHPFTDINGHSYEREIIKAYNAGIVGGYQDGTFKPDKTITRQEIAVLIVNLLRAINSERDLSASVLYTYSDSKSIGTWSLDQVNYCYSREIMRGKGKDKAGRDIMDPTGPATIEQSIVMLYRLAGAEAIIGKNTYGTIKVVSNLDGQEVITDSSAINDFARGLGNTLADKVVEISAKEGATISLIQSDAVNILLNDIGAINITEVGNSIDLYATTTNLTSTLFQEELLKLITAINPSSELRTAVQTGFSNLQTNSRYTYNEMIGTKNNLQMYLDADVESGSQPQYVFHYIHMNE